MNNSPYVPMFEIMDELAGELGEKVVQQVGSLPFKGKNSDCFTSLSDKKMAKMYDSASLIVGHAGIGTIVNGLKRNIPLVLVPRTVVYPEAENDQQAIVAHEVESMGRAVVVEDLSELKDKIEDARRLKMEPYVPDDSLCRFLSDLFGELDSERDC